MHRHDPERHGFPARRSQRTHCQYSGSMFVSRVYPGRTKDDLIHVCSVAGVGMWPRRRSAASAAFLLAWTVVCFFLASGALCLRWIGSFANPHDVRFVGGWRSMRVGRDPAPVTR